MVKLMSKIYDREFKELVNLIYEKELNLNNKYTSIINKMKLAPSYIYNDKTYRLEILFKESDEVNSSKDLNDFYNTLQHRSTYVNDNIRITIEGDKNLNKRVLQKYIDIITFENKVNVNKYYTKKYFKEKILVRLSALVDILDYAHKKNLKIWLNNKETNLIYKNIKLEYELKEEKDYCIIELKQNLKDFGFVIYTANNVFIIYKNKIYKCDEKYSSSEFELLETFLRNSIKEIKFKKEDLTTFFSLVLPKVGKEIVVTDKKLFSYKPDELKTNLYLDFNEKGYIIANIKFKYNNFEFNPLEEEPKEVKRNILQESMFLDKLRKTGFLFDGKNKCFVITDDDIIYKFIKTEIDKFMNTSNIYATENLNRKKSRMNKKISIGVKIDNGLLNVNLNDLNYSKEELKEILKKYRLRKKYHRLKDGTFVDLEENPEIEFLDNLISGTNLSYKEIDDYIRLPINRAFYLEKLLDENTSINANIDKNYRQFIESVDKFENKKIPKELDKTLRDYQKIGFKWLSNIDLYNFGGILADDMGLGKTIQVLSVVLDYVVNTKKSKTSLVVCPSSLTLNWYNETKKFAPDLKVLVISGDAQEREKKIKNLESFDIIVTSYDLLKRDIDLYKELEYKFKFLIADEAQYIKNNNTKNSRAIKQIEADTKYALTGTPIENSLNELWSIFDLIMPGYLFTYKKFKKDFETPIIKDKNDKKLNNLKMLIEPFVLRRTKKEVLKELPDKLTSVVNNEMTEEQEKIYLSYLAQARDELNEEIETKGFEQTRIKILALLTRLRQICCHPSLFITNYKGESGKLNQCMELVKDGIESGHKIILFSGYTSMFKIIEEELKKNNINYLKLTGRTKIRERLNLINEFNSNEDIKLFLISLKAGGTGINLTSADMVIHYDPWWNLSVENQATDRTHRIGQTKKVQVYKMITKNSIEEKIYDLQKRKEELIDNMLSTNTKFINKLSKEDILKLFE